MYLFFDTETTGLPKNWKAPISDLENWPRMVQLAWILSDEKGEEIEQANHIIRPDGFEIPISATKIHSISHDEALKNGVMLSKVLREFAEVMHRSDVLVAHNISFDENIIGAELLRERVPSDLEDIDKICTMKVSSQHCKLPSKYGYKWPTLPQLHNKLFDVTFRDAHNAEEDVRACAKSFFELQKLGVVN